MTQEEIKESINKYINNVDTYFRSLLDDSGCTEDKYDRSHIVNFDLFHEPYLSLFDSLDSK